MALPSRRPYDVAVLNSIAAAAADLSLSAGRLSCTNLGTTPQLVGTNRSSVKTAYAAGTASVKYVDYGAVSLAANTLYTISVEVPNAIAFPGGGIEANQLSKIRTYSWFSGTSAPTAAQVATALVALINADPQARVSAAVTTTDRVTCTLLNVADGDFYLSNYNDGGVLATSTPYVAPAGTPAIVEEFAPGKSSASATYTTWKITYNELFANAAIAGLKAYKTVDVYIFANTADADYADFATELDAILAGTHTPAADYL